VSLGTPLAIARLRRPRITDGCSVGAPYKSENGFMRMKQNFKRVGIATAAAAAALILVSCGRQAFLVTDSIELKQGPGTFLIPPKVDFILAQDDTAGISELRNELRSQMPVFLNALESRGWDYRFATVPLTNDRELTQVVASRYDSNWGSSWISPFPGANPNSFRIASHLFRTPGQYTGFIDYVDNTSGSFEDGFANISDQLSSRLNPSGMLRNDSLQVVLVVSTGEDTSYVNYCRSDFYNRDIPCGSYPETGAAPKWNGTVCTDLTQVNGGHYCDSRALSANYFKSVFQASKPVPQLSRVYAAVSTTGSSNSSRACRSGYAFKGSRYMGLAGDTGGRSYDICSQPVASVLDQLSQELQAVRVGFRTRYVFTATQPDPNTIRVIKYVNGNPAEAVEIFQSASSGWTFEGFRSNIYTIDYPINMNLGTGWTIELHGSSKAVGNDRIEVFYKPAGVSNTSS
jgi:hypothetical protein